jgi:hypothetical protein
MFMKHYNLLPSLNVVFTAVIGFEYIILFSSELLLVAFVVTVNYNSIL